MRSTLTLGNPLEIHQSPKSPDDYLGHAKISKTYWYLTGVPELMALVGTKFEHYAQAAEAGDE